MIRKDFIFPPCNFRGDKGGLPIVYFSSNVSPKAHAFGSHIAYSKKAKISENLR